MKVNEIINEGPLWDKAMAAKTAAVGGAKKVAAGVGNAAKSVAKSAQGASQYYQNRQAAGTATKTINDVAKRVTAEWAAQKAQLTTGGIAPTLETFAQFMQPRTPTATGPTEEDFANPSAYIRKAIAQHFANRSNGITTPLPPDSTAGTTAIGNMASQLTKSSTPASPQQAGVTTHAASPNNPNALPKTATKTPTPIQVRVKGAGIITKNPTDGAWYDEQGDKIVRPEDIKYLEQAYSNQSISRQMSDTNRLRKAGELP